MTLEECFKIYKDTDKIIRKNKFNPPFPNRPNDIESLKKMFPSPGSARREASIGFMIFREQIEEQEANDWELFDGNNESYKVTHEEQLEVEQLLEDFSKMPEEELVNRFMRGLWSPNK